MEQDELEKTLRRLKHGIVRVTFNKINGEERVMDCTLAEAHIPPADKKDTASQEKARKLNEEVTNVWDITAHGWRSFRNANVTAVKLLGTACSCGKSENWPYCDGSHNNIEKEVIHNVYRTGSN
jgi:hypothetical protein